VLTAATVTVYVHSTAPRPVRVRVIFIVIVIVSVDADHRKHHDVTIVNKRSFNVTPLADTSMLNLMIMN
jgi:hypothetical protein